MNDFLHSLRSGNQKRYDRSRKGYEGQSHTNERQGGGRDSRKSSGPRRSMDTELLSTIRKLLEEVLDNQRYVAEMSERRIRVEERKAEAFEGIVELLKSRGTSIASVIPSPAPAPTVELGNISLPPRTTGASRSKVVKQIVALREQGLSYEKIAQHLQAAGVPTLSGRGKWRGQTILRLFQGSLMGTE